ncbi:Fumarate reductase flavoprotein subunit precursor (plasmid) [Variovorax sp. SRS16]|nr:Fumarate reductase flavoprotein subunit precursor [Variovorax sp. SRS16]
MSAMDNDEAVDVIVVGAGNAALCAAISAAENGARVRVLERAPADKRGGNSAFSGGAFRVAYDGAADIHALVPDLSASDLANTDFGSYARDRFLDELMEMSSFRADLPLVELMVERSFETLQWMRSHGVRFLPSYGRQTYKVDGRQIFWGGLTIEAAGGGFGLVESLFARAERLGVRIDYEHRIEDLRVEDGVVTGVLAMHRGLPRPLRAGAVVLGAGGFHANAAWRASYLGNGWDLAKVRGSRYNTGDAIRIAMAHGARAHGHWSGCHGVFYDANAPQFGDIALLDQQKNYFTLGIVVNTRGERFIDEGEDFRNYTYSRMGAELLRQPGGRGWQIFDAQTVGMLPQEYRVKHASRIHGDTLEALVARLEGVDRARLLRTIADYNAAIDDSKAFNPAVKDGRCTRGLAIDKSNWSVALSQGPFVAYEVTTGITCTYAGLAIDTEAQVQSVEGEAMPGLYAAGELVGGLYYTKYPGGAGLTSGSVFGRVAGKAAALHARSARVAQA